MVALFLLFAASSMIALHAQPATNIAPPLNSQPATTCLPTTTLDELIKAVDDAVSGPADKDRACFRALFLPGATLNPLLKPADGTLAPHTMNADGWIEAVKKRGKANLTEHQVKVTTETYGHLAHLWSTYELRIGTDSKSSSGAAPGDTPSVAPIKGINSIQAVYDGKQWHIFDILWQAETPEEKVPAKYLP